MREISSETTVTGKTLAAVLGVSPRTVNRIQQEHGVFDKRPNGRYPLNRSVQAYISHKLESTMKRGAHGDYEAQRALREETRHEMDKLKLRRMRGELHEANAVAQVWGDLLTDFRQQLQALPGKLTPLLIGMDNPDDVMAFLDAQIFETLEALAKSKPEDYRTADDWTGDDDDEDELPEDGKPGD